MNIANLKQRQIMLSFAYMAYCGELITTPKPEETILGYINSAMPQIPPIAAPNNDKWKVVWGPTVYTVPGALYQDNMMYVVQNEADKTQFAIAIRGTNFLSDLDWLMEDFDVLNMMNWPPGAANPTPSGAKISESTSIGLQILLAMQGASSGASQSLMSFLASQTSSAINLCITGHSLGGCLAGTLALYLKENHSTWDSSGKSIVSCITFAAPTAGNAAFAAYSDLKFKGATYSPNWDASLQTNCDAVRCDYDVAPQAWIASNLLPNNAGNDTPLFSTYGSHLDFTKMDAFSKTAWELYIVPKFLPYIADMISTQNYKQIESSAKQLSGTFNKDFAPKAKDNSLTSYIEAFIAQAAWQHGNSYPNILGVEELLDSSIINKGDALIPIKGKTS